MPGTVTSRTDKVRTASGAAQAIAKAVGPPQSWPTRWKRSSPSRSEEFEQVRRDALLGVAIGRRRAVAEPGQVGRRPGDGAVPAAASPCATRAMSAASRATGSPGRRRRSRRHAASAARGPGFDARSPCASVETRRRRAGDHLDRAWASSRGCRSRRRLDDLRRYAVARTLFKPTTLARAIEKLGFVQADPIRAPARAQDLTLRHRVAGYRAGDLERRYARLADRGGLLRQLRLPAAPPPGADAPAHAARRLGRRRRSAQAAEVLAFVRERGPTHPRDVEAHFAHGRRTNCLGRLEQRDDAPARRHALPRPAARRRGATAASASTPRVEHRAGRRPSRRRARRARRAGRARRAQVRAAAGVEPGLPGAACSRYGAPQLRDGARAALAAARDAAARSARIDGVDWYWPADENPRSARHARRRPRAPARAVRSGRLGPAPLRAALGLDLSLRGLHAGAASASSATTRCRCSGATGSIGWAQRSPSHGRPAGVATGMSPHSRRATAVQARARRRARADGDAFSRS